MTLEALKAIDLEQIKDPIARQGMVLLLNLVEELSAENQRLRAENQRLRDENQRLKGEQGKPEIKPGKRQEAKAVGSEQERRQGREWQKRQKLPEIRIDRVEELTMAAQELPEDAEFKGYEAVVVQDVKVMTDNVRFLKAKYYSPSQHRSYLAPLPPGYTGEFGPGVRALVTTLAYGSRMTQPAMAELLANMGVLISAGQLSNLLVHGQERFHAEKQALLAAGLHSTSWQMADATTMRWDGQNAYTHVLANAWYTVFTTKAHKDRQTLLEVLQGSEVRRYLLSGAALRVLAAMAFSPRQRRRLAALQSEQVWAEGDFLAWLDQVSSGPGAATAPPSLGRRRHRRLSGPPGLAGDRHAGHGRCPGIPASDRHPWLVLGA